MGVTDLIDVIPRQQWIVNRYAFINVACIDEHVGWIIIYRLSFADQGKQVSVCSKQTEVCRFPFQQNIFKLLFTVSSVFCWRNSGNMVSWTWRYGDIDITHDTWRHGILKNLNGKQKPRRFSLIRLTFTHCANGSLSFVCLLTKKRTEVILLRRDLPIHDSMYMRWWAKLQL